MSALAVATGPEDRELDDLDLVAAVRAGDDRAFETLYLRYQPRIAGYVCGMVHDHGRAEDITQEVFMSALRRLRSDDEREILFRPWIYEIAKNKCIDAYRRGRNTTELSFDAHDQVGAAEHRRLADPGTTPDAAVEGKLAFDNLRGAFGGLSPVHHEILVMREFEGLSYREIGERLGMSRTAVESTLFRARKRLGEEYEELVSGKRCVRVQRIVEAGGLRAAGMRDQRRVARHLAHCQPCRRHAYLTGADLDLVRPASVPARVAAFLPLPAFLRRRWGGNEEASQFLSQQAARPIAQWSAHMAGTLDPAAMSVWAKVAAAAATVALAGVGGAALEHRGGPAAKSPASARDATAASSAASSKETRSGTPRRVGAGLPLPASAAADAAAGRGSAGSAGTGRGGSSATPGDPASSATSGGSRSGTTADARGGSGGLPADPLAPVGDTTGRAVAPVLDAVGNPTRTLDPPVRSTGDVAAGAVPQAGRLLSPVVPPAVTGVGATADTVVPTGGGGQGRLDERGGVQGIVPAPGAPGDAHLPAHAAEQADDPNATPRRALGITPGVSGTLANPTSAAPSLGG